jgi:hypothetical protein
VLSRDNARVVLKGLGMRQLSIHILI